jgi:hypothetical protein
MQKGSMFNEFHSEILVILLFSLSLCLPCDPVRQDTPTEWKETLVCGLVAEFVKVK